MPCTEGRLARFYNLIQDKKVAYSTFHQAVLRNRTTGGGGRLVDDQQRPNIRRSVSWFRQKDFMTEKCSGHLRVLATWRLCVKGCRNRAIEQEHAEITEKKGFLRFLCCLLFNSSRYDAESRLCESSDSTQAMLDRPGILS